MYINPDQLHAPCYHPLRKVWSVKIGYRKFEFKSKKEAQKFHLKHCDKKNIIPAKQKNEVYCSDAPPEALSWESKKIAKDIAYLMSGGSKTCKR